MFCSPRDACRVRGSIERFELSLTILHPPRSPRHPTPPRTGRRSVSRRLSAPRSSARSARLPSARACSRWRSPCVVWRATRCPRRNKMPRRIRRGGRAETTAPPRASATLDAARLATKAGSGGSGENRALSTLCRSGRTARGPRRKIATQGRRLAARMRPPAG